MRPIFKLGIVAIGYIAAFAIAWVAVAMYIAATSGPDRQTYGAMYDFGDSLYFLAVFGFASVPPTGIALFFLRPHRRFWRTLSIASLVLAATSLAPLVTYAFPETAGSILSAWSGLVPLRVLAAPFVAAFFLLSGVIAPNRSARISLLVATAVETTVFIYVALKWLRPV